MRKGKDYNAAMNFGYYLYNLVQLGTWPLWLSPFLNRKRRALFLKRLKPPQSPEKNGPLVWVHALSVGEAQAAQGVLKALKAFFPETTLILSVTTTAGFRFAREKLAPWVDLVLASPFDLWPITKTFIRRLCPCLFLLIETDLWPNLLWNLKKAKIPCVLLNASISEASYKRLKMIPGGASFLYAPFERIFAASPDDAYRLKRLLPHHKDIHFWGNIKFDLDLPEVDQVKGLFAELGRHLTPPVIVCGSTHPGEEMLLLKAFKRFGQGSLVICPRHPDRATEILSQAATMGFKSSLRTKPSRCQVMVVDTLGELKALYALADIAFLGGTLVPIGGHNILEPASLGVPITFGPFIESIKNLAEDFQRQGAGVLVKPEAYLIATGWQKVYEDKQAMGAKAQEIFRQHQGVVSRIIEDLNPFLTLHLGREI